MGENRNACAGFLVEKPKGYTQFERARRRWYGYSSPNVRVIRSKRMRWAGHVARMGERRGALRVLVGKPERKRPLGRPKLRWEDNIKVNLQDVGRLRKGTGGGLL